MCEWVYAHTFLQDTTSRSSPRSSSTATNMLQKKTTSTWRVSWWAVFPPAPTPTFFFSSRHHCTVVRKKAHHVILPPWNSSFATRFARWIWAFCQIGNAALDEDRDQRGMVDYAWDHAVMSDELYAEIKLECDFRKRNQSSKCDDAMTDYYNIYKIIDMYSLNSPTCDSHNSTGSPRQLPLVRGAVPGLLSKFVSALCPFVFLFPFVLELRRT